MVHRSGGQGGGFPPFRSQAFNVGDRCVSRPASGGQEREDGGNSRNIAYQTQFLVLDAPRPILDHLSVIDDSHDRSCFLRSRDQDKAHRQQPNALDGRSRMIDIG
jgi:hypothetical protein